MLSQYRTKERWLKTLWRSCFQSGGEIHRGQTWVSHSRGGQRGSILLLHPELHPARYQKNQADVEMGVHVLLQRWDVFWVQSVARVYVCVCVCAIVLEHLRKNRWGDEWKVLKEFIFRNQVQHLYAHSTTAQGHLPFFFFFLTQG